MATHTGGNERPLGFIGRKREVDDFTQILREPFPADEHRVISIYGRGGQGKSALLATLRESLKLHGKGGHASALVDFADANKRRQHSALLHLRHQIQKDGIPTPAYDVAFARAFMLSHPGEDIRQVHPEFFGAETSVLGDLIEVLGALVDAIPGGKLVYSTLTKASSKLKERHRRGALRVLDNIDAKSVAELQRDLPLYLGHDLSRSRNDEEGRQVVVFLDTFELLWDDKSAATRRLDSGTDEWVRRLIEESPGVLFVIAGRRSVDWTRIDPDWGRAVRPCPLESLDPRDVEALLDILNISNRELRDHFVKLADGHPLTIQLLGSSYDKIARRGTTPSVSDFPTVQAQVIDRYFSHLDRASLAVIRALAVPSGFSRFLWDHYSYSGFSAFDLCSPAEILGEAFFSPQSDGTYFMHSSVRVAAIESLRQDDPQLLKRLQLCVVDLVDRATSTNPEDRAGTAIPNASYSLAERDPLFEEAARILLEVDETLFVEWCIRTLDRTEMHGGSNHRDHWISQIERIADSQENPSTLLMCQLAKVRVRTNPFSDDALKALARALAATTESSRNHTAHDALRTALWHASQVRGTVVPFGRDLLEPVISLSPAAEWPELDLRLGYLIRDSRLLEELIDKAISAGKGEANWEVVQALSFIGEPTGLRLLRRLANPDMQRFDPFGVVDYLLILDRPAWALDYLAHFFQAEPLELDDRLLEKFAQLKRCPPAQVALLMVIECLLKTNFLDRARRILEVMMPRELWPRTVAFARDELEDAHVDEATTLERAEAIEKEFDVRGLLACHLRAFRATNPAQIALLDPTVRSRIDWLIERLIAKGSLEGTMPSPRFDSNDFLYKLRVIDASLGELPGGGIAVVKHDPNFCNRTCDYFLLDMHGVVHFQDLRVGRGKVEHAIPLERRRLIGQGASLASIWPSCSTGKAVGCHVPLYLMPPEGAVEVPVLDATRSPLLGLPQ